MKKYENRHLMYDEIGTCKFYLTYFSILDFRRKVIFILMDPIVATPQKSTPNLSLSTLTKY